ncbi:MAG: ATP-binding protein [Flavobacteriales bacterium]|nr:ATP-binding protein [Flavobacteriales bacterium]
MENIEKIYAESSTYLKNLDPLFRRDQIEDVDWAERLLFIKGSRGIGKTTLILQHIQEQYGYDSKVLYVSMDSLQLLDYKLIELAEYHFNHGGTHLFVDEIHKYQNWSLELKNINDLYKKLNVVVSGSSILHLYKGNADLSRRGVSFKLRGLSFREFLNIETKSNFPKYSLDDLLQNHLQIAADIGQVVNPLQYIKEYLKYGYNPYYLEGKSSFHHKLNNTVNLIIETDITQLFGVDVSKIIKLKKLLYAIAVNVPFQPNTSKLATSLEISRSTLNAYLQYLHEAEIIHLLWKSGQSYSLISKPEKIYLNNTNLCFLVPESSVNVGNLRETFFVNQVSAMHDVFASTIGDFLVDDKYIFEVGGPNKKFTQIANQAGSYKVQDEILIGAKNNIPLWLFGFLY